MNKLLTGKMLDQQNIGKADVTILIMKQVALNAKNVLPRNDYVIRVIHYKTFVGKLREHYMSCKAQ